MGGVAAAGRASVDCPRAHRSHEPAPPNRRPQDGQMGWRGAHGASAGGVDRQRMVERRVLVWRTLRDHGESWRRRVGSISPECATASHQASIGCRRGHRPDPLDRNVSLRQGLGCGHAPLARLPPLPPRHRRGMERGREIPPPRPRGRVPRVRLRPGRACGGIIVPGVWGGGGGDIGRATDVDRPGPSQCRGRAGVRRH